MFLSKHSPISLYIYTTYSQPTNRYIYIHKAYSLQYIYIQIVVYLDSAIFPSRSSIKLMTLSTALWSAWTPGDWVISASMEKILVQLFLLKALYFRTAVKCSETWTKTGVIYFFSIKDLCLRAPTMISLALSMAY